MSPYMVYTQQIPSTLREDGILVLKVKVTVAANRDYRLKIDTIRDIEPEITKPSTTITERYDGWPNIPCIFRFRSRLSQK
jgi:hypothetical protein